MIIKSIVSSIHDKVEQKHIDWLIATKKQMDIYRDLWHRIAVVLVTGDLTNASHVQYIKHVRATIEQAIWDNFKLFVWVESDWTTEMRKEKQNTYSEDERKYIFENMKPVDHAFVSFSNNEKRPYGSTQFLQPDVYLSHEEYYPNLVGADEVDERTKEWWWRFIVVQEEGKEELLWEMSRREWIGRSTTNTILSLFELYHDNPKYNLRLQRE